MTLTWLPIALLAVPGVALLFLRRRTPCVAFLLRDAGGACRPERPRALPCAILHLRRATARGRGRIHSSPVVDALSTQAGARTAIVGLALAGVAYAGWSAHRQVLPGIESRAVREYNEAIPSISRLLPADALLYASNYNLAFETDREGELIPDTETSAELFEALCEEAEPEESPYIYIGSVERDPRFRGALVRDIGKASRLSWLHKIAQGQKTEWQLYRVDLSDCATQAPASVASP